MEKKENSEWREVKYIEKIFFSNWNIKKNLFEVQIKKTLEICFEEKIASSLDEEKIKFKLIFYGGNGKKEQGKPDILITLITNEDELIKKEKLWL